MKIGIIGGTPKDTQLGINFISTLKKYNVIGYSTCNTVQEQNKLQQFDPSLLLKKTVLICKKLQIKQVDKIIIYCNSLSSSLDLKELSNIINIPIITPFDAYNTISNSFNNLGILAANSIGANGTEIILSYNKKNIIFSIGSLKIVEYIEKNDSLENIYTDLGLENIIGFAEKNDIELLVLGCTHFGIIQNKIQVKTNLIKIWSIDEGFKNILE